MRYAVDTFYESFLLFGLMDETELQGLDKLSKDLRMKFTWLIVLKIGAHESPYFISYNLFDTTVMRHL